MLPNEDFINHVEEQFINWDDDAEMMNQTGAELPPETGQF